jgi:hypothetical protein
VDPPDRHGIEEMQLLPAAPSGDHQSRLFQHPQMLHDAEASHPETPHQLAQALTVALEERVEQSASGGIGQGPEDRVGVHNG